MKRICRHPLFVLGLVIRLSLIAGLVPLAVSHWYVPFLDNSIAPFTLDPWTAWMTREGTLVAFPYGSAMWLAFLPATLSAKFIGIPLRFGYGITLLLADLGLLSALHHLLPNRQRLLLATYWLSPIVILASYALGLNDIVPAFFLTLSVFCLRRTKLKQAGMWCAVAISAKLSMIVALPLIAIYLYNNKALRQRGIQFVSHFLIWAAVLGLPFIFSHAGLQMLFGNPEMTKIYALELTLGKNTSVHILPLAYMLMLYGVWRVKRLNFDLFQATAGMAFLLIVLLTPASPGWFVWSIPFLVLYQAMSGRIAIFLVGSFSMLYVLSTLTVTPLVFANNSVLFFGQILTTSAPIGIHTVSLLHTTMIAIGLILSFRIWREAIKRNDFFRLSRKPFVIGVAGDSGAGKDTFSDSLQELLGSHSVVKLSGDDYHLWDRQKPMWQVMTHLNPMANDLAAFCEDLVALNDGKTIQSRHYDHQSGKMSKPFYIKSNDFIIASGLHALYLPILRDCYNLKIYLDIDEGLRRHFKIRRDVYQRGHTLDRVLNSFEKRAPDSARFIRPQSVHADLTFSLQPIHPHMLEDTADKSPLRLKLQVKTPNGFNELTLNRVLVGVCGLHVDIVVSNDGTSVQMTIEGETSAADMNMAAQMLCPRILDFLDIQPNWQDGILGLMQLITLTHLSQALTKRII